MLTWIRERIMNILLDSISADLKAGHVFTNGIVSVLRKAPL